MATQDVIRENAFGSETIQRITEMFGGLTKFLLKMELAGANFVFLIVFSFFVLMLVGAITSPFWMGRFFDRAGVSNFSDLFSGLFSRLVKFFK